MGVVYNRKGLGLYENGCGQLGTATNFSPYTLYTADSISNGSCMGMENTATYGSGKLGDEFVGPLDTSKSYQLSVTVKGLTDNYLSNPSGGHLGFSPYDEKYRFIDLRNCGGVGNTTLARDAVAGDSYVFITSDTGWASGAQSNHQCHIMLYPATHPEFSTAHEYTRIGWGEQSIYFDPTATVLTGSPPSYRLRLVTSDLSTATTFPSVGYSTPSGTPVMNGKAGGTYCYAHSNPNHVTGSWTTYTTSVFTGETRNSATPFRYGTKYIKFLNLANYNTRLETGGVSPTYAIDNIMLVECPNGKAWPDSLFIKANTL